jgi:hypothetical protein
MGHLSPVRELERKEGLPKISRQFVFRLERPVSGLSSSRRCPGPCGKVMDRRFEKRCDAIGDTFYFRFLFC